MNKICRICLEEGVLTSVFTKNYNISLCDMIEYCCNSIKISKDDGLPEQICSNCIYKLGIAYHFKQSCESGNIRLREYLGFRATTKSSDASVMTDPIAPVRTTVIKRCKCKLSERKRSTNYKRKSEAEKKKPGPKPKPKPTHSCFQCDKQFKCQAQLDMHVRTHTGDKPFECMYCPRRFTQKYNLTIHLRMHTGDKPYQCEVCSKRFSAQGNLHSHLKIHTGQRDHLCGMCNKSFITSSELTRHMSKHRDVKIKKFKCDACGSAYVYNRDLKVHKLKKHRIASENKLQDFNNSSNIDIIGIDVGKEAPLPMKEVNHFIPQLIDEKHTIPLIQSHPYDTRVLHQHTNKMFDTHNCTICGESFDYMSALAQHYLHRHKDGNVTGMLWSTASLSETVEHPK